MKVLIVEDDRVLAEHVRWAVREDGHAVDVARSGDEGQTLAMMHDYDVVVLDHILPQRIGLEILQHMRRQGKTTPVLMLTAKADEADVVNALDNGADDYLRKPLTIGELPARIRALGRRRPGTVYCFTAWPFMRTVAGYPLLLRMSNRGWFVTASGSRRNFTHGEPPPMLSRRGHARARERPPTSPSSEPDAHVA
jgi:DNA-binding response OmpR family regulator